MNKWKKLLKALKRLGYKGADGDLTAIKAFIAENNVSFETGDDGELDVDAAYEASKKKSVVALADDEGDDEDDAPRRKRKKVKNLADGGDDDEDDEDGGVAVMDDDDQADDDDDEGDEDDAAPAGAKALARVNAQLLKMKKQLKKRDAAAAAGALLRANVGLAMGGYSRPGVYNIATARKAYNARPKGKGDPRTTRKFSDFDAAVQFGVFAKGLLNPMGLTPDEAEMFVKTMTTTSATSTGVLIPQDLQPEILSLKDEYGVIRRLVGVTPMKSDSWERTRRTGGITVTAPGEGGPATASEPTLDKIKLSATKFMSESKISAESLSDSPVDLGNFLADEIATAHALNEDTIAIQGDGSGGSPYYGYLGLVGSAAAPGGKWRKVLEDGGGTWGTNNANLGGQVVGAGNAYSELTLPNFIDVVGRLPTWAKQKGKPCWLVNNEFFWNVMKKLALAAGGVYAAEIINGDLQNPTFLSYPVVESPIMPFVEANSQVCALFGAFDLSCKFGEVTGSMEIKASDQRYIEQDIVAVYSRSRIAWNFHEPGNYHATASSRVKGGITSLVTANS